MIRRPPLLPTALTLLGVIILFSLSSWQVRRLAWKTDLIAQTEAAHAATPAPLDMNALTPGAGIQRGILSGTPDHENEIRLCPRLRDEAVGCHVLTPLILADKTSVLLNRGWVPQDYEEHGTHSKAIQITGLLKPPPRRNVFTPQNNPAQDAWYHPDIKQIEQEKNLPGLHPYIFYAQTQIGTAPYPLPVDTRQDTLKNNHLSYALFWFTMGIVLIIVYALRFLIHTRAPS